MKKAVLIGAGQFGRGVIGMLLEQSGYHVVFADVNEAVIRDINERGEYTVRRIDEKDSSVTVKNISAVSSLSPELVEICASCDLLCTCTGLTALPKIAPAIAKSIAFRKQEGNTRFLNVLACENAIGGSTILKNHVLSHLDEEEQAYLEKYIGFPDCAIDGIIPPAHDALPADVTAEEYYEWDSLKSAFRGELPEIRGLNIVDDLSRYLERKLFTLNGPNAVTGCFGFRKGYQTVQESLADPEIYDTVWQMMEEAGEMLSARHGYTPEEMLQYRSFIMKRFQNRHIIDTCERVSREPLRKLAANDRIVAAMNYAHSYGIATPAYYKGIAEVLHYDNPNDAQSIEMRKMVETLGVREALVQISGIPAESDAADRIEAAYRRIETGGSRISDREILSEIRRTISEEADALRSLSERFDEESVLRAAKALQNCQGKVILTGCGTSGMAAKKIAHTLSCIEIPALYMCPADAVHGDLGVLQREDILILISKGGNTSELLALIPACKTKKALLIGVSEDPSSEIARSADIYLEVKVDREPCRFNMLATASTLAVISLFDALCIALMQMTGYTREQFAVIHPHGAVGERLLHHLN